MPRGSPSALRTAYQQTEHGAIAKDSEPGQIKLYARHQGRVFLHPSSVLFSAPKYPGTYLTYSRCLHTSKVLPRGPARETMPRTRGRP